MSMEALMPIMLMHVGIIAVAVGKPTWPRKAICFSFLTTVEARTEARILNKQPIDIWAKRK